MIAALFLIALGIYLAVGLLFAIGAANRKWGVVPTKLFPFWRAWRNCCEQATTYPAAD